MRIVHIITRMILGGAQENTLLTCEDLLHRRQDDVLLVTGPPLGPEGSLLDRARAQGVPLEIVPQLRRAIHPWHDWQSYRALQLLLRRFQPDVVHTHSAKAGLLGRAAAWSLNVPAVVHAVHGAPFHPYQPWLAREFFRQCERWAGRRCHAYTCVCQAMTDQLVAAGVDRREKFHTIYGGMEVEPFLECDALRRTARQRLGYDEGHIVFGKVARLFHLKGHEYLIAAAQKVVQKFPQARFLLVGDGILREMLQKRISAAGLAAHFQFTGLVPPTEIPALISAMDAVVHASLREGLPRAVAQGVLCGKPVVAFDVDGAREVCLGDVTGFLVRPQDVDGLAAAMIQLAADPALRRRLGSTGRARFADVFRHESATARQRELYVRLLGRT